MNQDENLLYTIPVSWPEEFREYHDIVYSRLDLPEPPVLDEDKFQWWCERSQNYLLTMPTTQTFVKSNGTYTSAFHDNQNVRKETFPYSMFPVITRAKSQTDNPWVEDFNTLFPEMVHYFRMFPGAYFRSLGFIKQNTNMPVWDHTDNDEWIGFRFYMKNNCHDNRLFFKKVKPEYMTGNRYNTYMETPEGKKVRDFTNICDQSKIYPKNNIGRYAWALTSVKAAHGIDASGEDETRITAIAEFWPVDRPGIVKGFKVKETRDLLERSITKFKDEVIWYK